MRLSNPLLARHVPASSTATARHLWRTVVVSPAMRIWSWHSLGPNEPTTLIWWSGTWRCTAEPLATSIRPTSISKRWTRPCAASSAEAVRRGRPVGMTVGWREAWFGLPASPRPGGADTSVLFALRPLGLGQVAETFGVGAGLGGGLLGGTRVVELGLGFVLGGLLLRFDGGVHARRALLDRGGAGRGALVGGCLLGGGRLVRLGPGLALSVCLRLVGLLEPRRCTVLSGLALQGGLPASGGGGLASLLAARRGLLFETGRRQELLGALDAVGAAPGDVAVV